MAAFGVGILSVAASFAVVFVATVYPPPSMTLHIRINRHSIRNYSWRSATINSTHTGVLAEIGVTARAKRTKTADHIPLRGLRRFCYN